MIIRPGSLRFRASGDTVEIEIDGKSYPVDRVTKAFPKTDPGAYVSFLDRLGHEIGLLESTDGMDTESKLELIDHLKRIYYVSAIQEIHHVEATGTTSRWHVRTDEGERTFQIPGRESLDCDKPPAMQITDSEGRRYQIQNYWKLDKESRQAIKGLLPDKIVKSRLAPKSKGTAMRMR